MRNPSKIIGTNKYEIHFSVSESQNILMDHIFLKIIKNDIFHNYLTGYIL